jgi:hypothetical protein
VRVGVTAIQAFASKISEKMEIGILRGSKISMDKYLGIREDYIKRTKLLEEEIEKENVHKTNFENIKTKNLKLEADLISSKLLENSSAKDAEDLRKDLEELQPTKLKNIASVFDAKAVWENHFILPNGREDVEYFTCTDQNFSIRGGGSYKIQNVILSADKKALSFDKVIKNKTHHNNLIVDSENNYCGIEDEKTIVKYRKQVKPYIEIISAKYFRENNYIDVKAKLQKMVDNNITKITPTNSEMGGDPCWGEPKTLEVNYEIDGKKKISRYPENVEFTID